MHKEPNATVVIHEVSWASLSESRGAGSLLGPKLDVGGRGLKAGRKAKAWRSCSAILRGVVAAFGHVERDALGVEETAGAVWSAIRESVGYSGALERLVGGG